MPAQEPKVMPIQTSVYANKMAPPFAKMSRSQTLPNKRTVTFQGHDMNFDGQIIRGHQPERPDSEMFIPRQDDFMNSGNYKMERSQTLPNDITSRKHDDTSHMNGHVNGWSNDHSIQQVASQKDEMVSKKQEMDSFKTHVEFHGPDLTNQRFSYSNYEELKKATLKQNMHYSQSKNQNRFSYSNFEGLRNDQIDQRRNKIERSQTLPLNQRSPAAQKIRRSRTLNSDGSPLLHHRLQRILSSQDLDFLEELSRDRNFSQSQSFDIYEQMRTVCSSSGDLTDVIKEHLDKSETFSNTPSPERRKKKHFYDNNGTAQNGSVVPLKGSLQDDEFDVENGIEVFIDYDPITDKVKTPSKTKQRRSKMASNNSGSHDNNPPGGSAADSANNNIRQTGKLTSQLSTETEGTLSTCSTLDRYSTLDRLARGEDRHISNSDFEDMCKANDLSDTDTLTGSPHVRSPVEPSGEFPLTGTGLNVSKDFISPGLHDGLGSKSYMEQLDELINEPLIGEDEEQISVTTTHDTIGQMNMDYFAQLDAPIGANKSNGGESKDNGRNGRGNDISARVDKDTMDLLAQLDRFGPRPKQIVTATEEIVSVSNTQDTIGLPNLDYLAQLEGGKNGDKQTQVQNRLSVKESDGCKIVISTATGDSPGRSPVFTRRATGGILGKVSVFENLERRRSGYHVTDDDEVKAIEEQFNDFQGLRDFRDLEEIRAKEAEERLDSLGPEEDEDERNKSVRDAINIFERFKSSLKDVNETPRQSVQTRTDAFEKYQVRPDAHVKATPKQDVGLRPALRPQQAFEKSFESSSLEHEKPRSPTKEERDSRLRQDLAQKAPPAGLTENKSDRNKVKYRSSSADRFTDPNRLNVYKKRDVSPRFSSQNAGEPEEDKRRLKLRSQSGDRIRPKSEYRAHEEKARRGRDGSSSEDYQRPRGRPSRKEERGRQTDRNADRYDQRQITSDPEYTYTSDEHERRHDISPLPRRDEIKRRSGFERHLEQPPTLSPVNEVRPLSGHYDNQLSPPPYDPRRRSGSYERQPALIVSPQPGERRSGSYDRPQVNMALSPHVPYADYKRLSGNYDRPGRQDGPPTGPPPVPQRAMPRPPPGFERELRIPPYRDPNQFTERRDSPVLREDRGSPYQHEHGPGSPRCFSPQQRPYGEREGSPKCFSPRQWPYQDREGGRGSPQCYSPHHRQDGFYHRPEDDPIYARVHKTNRPYYGPPEPGTFYMHDRPEQWQRSPHHDYHDQRYYDSRPPQFRYPPYQGYPQDPYMRYSQDYTHRDWEYQDRQPYSMNYPPVHPPPIEVCPYHHPTDARGYHDPHSPKIIHQNEPRGYQEPPGQQPLHLNEPRGYEEPLSPKRLEEMKTPYDNVDNLGPLRHIPPHLRGPSPTGYHSDDPNHLRKMTEHVQRQQALKKAQQQGGESRNFYSDFHPGDPYRQDQVSNEWKYTKSPEKPREWKYGEANQVPQDDPYGHLEESTDWKYASQQDKQNWKYGDEVDEDAKETDSAFRRYLPEDDPFAQLNPVTRAPDLGDRQEKMASFDSDMIPSYSDLPDQEAVQSQDLLDQYMAPPRQMKLRPKHVKKEKEVKKVAPLAIKPDPMFDRNDTLRSTSTTTSTLKSFATDTIGSSKSWGKYDPFVNPSAFAPELGLELMPNWGREDRDRTPTRSGPPPQRSLSDPSESESTKPREVRPYNRSRTSPSALPVVSVNSPSPAGERQTKGTNLNRDVWVQMEARRPRPAPPTAVSSTNLNQIEIASSVTGTKTTSSPCVEKTNSWQYNRGSGNDKEASDSTQHEEAPPVPERDILKEKGVFFSQSASNASGLKKNFDETRGPELSRKKLIYRKSHSDTRIPITIKAERPTTLNIQHEFSKPDEDLKNIERSKLRERRARHMTVSAFAVKSDGGHVEVKRELRELSSSRGAKIAGIKTAMFEANGKQEVIIHPLPVKTQTSSSTSVNNGNVSYCQDLAEEEYLVNVTKETKVKKVPVIQDHLAELEGLFQELDLDNEHLLENAERHEIRVNLKTQGDNLLKGLGNSSVDTVECFGVEGFDEPMPSLEYARKWLAEENERILMDAAEFESMLDNSFGVQGQSSETSAEKNSDQLLGHNSKVLHSDSSSVISDTKSASGGSANIPRHPIFPRKIADDMLTRKVARSNSSSSVPALPLISPISFLALTPALSPSASAECINRRARSHSKTPDAVLDDINFRKIYRSISQPVIDNQEVKAKPSPTSADYLRERTTEPLRQLRLRVQKNADMYHDDLAYRRLRKDVPPLQTDVVFLRQRSRSLDNIQGRRSSALRHRRPPDGKSSAEKPSEAKPRRIRNTSLSKGVANLVDLFDSSEDSGKSLIKLSHSLPDLSGFRSELSVDFDDRGNIVSADPKYIQHARHPKKTPRSVKMKSRLRQKYSDSETGDSGDRSDPGTKRHLSGDSSDNQTSEGGLSGSEDASHEFEVTSNTLTSQSHDSDRTSDLESKRPVVDVDSWGKQGSDRFKRSPVIEPDVFNSLKQTDDKIKNWYKSHQESFDKRFAYFESDCKDRHSVTPNRYRISLRKSASQDNLSGATAKLQMTQIRDLYVREGEHISRDRAKHPVSLRVRYGSDPCLAEGRSKPPKHTDSLGQFRSILHFTAPNKQKVKT